MSLENMTKDKQQQLFQQKASRGSIKIQLKKEKHVSLYVSCKRLKYISLYTNSSSNWSPSEKEDTAY